MKATRGTLVHTTRPKEKLTKEEIKSIKEAKSKVFNDGKIVRK